MSDPRVHSVSKSAASMASSLASGGPEDIMLNEVTSSSILASNQQTSFPFWSLQPRRETGAINFIKKYPDYDGRGTIMAILDSGLDPGAGGLQITSDGKRKVIDRIDASGSADVDTSKKAEIKDGNKIKGVTGRILTLPQDCTGYAEYRIGAKRAFSLYPWSLRERMVKERQEKLWDPNMSRYRAEASKKLQAFINDDQDSRNSNGGGALNGMAKLSKENAEAELEVLSMLDKKFKETNGNCGDVGPIYDVVLFKDDKGLWNVLIDTSESGDLSRGVRLRSFRETGDISPLTKEDRLNVSLTVFDEGDICQLVSACSAHGTHVASIAAAHFPGEPQKDGLAPGAQIVSISIGDGRLHSMETGTALARACMYLMQSKHYKVDVVNMSYGEHSHWSNSGRIGDLMNEVINKHGIVWVASAGNAGPALSTVGTPPDISTNSVIGVGAYVSPEMMVALYSTRDKLPGTPYTWTSRGPTIDGDRGVTICAPGGAITSVPHFTLRASQLMNGTSMASPHCCGAVSLLLSGMKQLGLESSPFSVKRALANSAMPLPHLCEFAQGHGLLQIEAAFDHLIKNSSAMERNVRFAVTCNGGTKGIHLRGKSAMRQNEIPVKIEPVFLDADRYPNDSKINFNMKFVLSCGASWVQCADYLDMTYSIRHFLVMVDPTGLAPGAHAAYIKAYDVSNIQKGPVFEIPITVVKPEPLVEKPRPYMAHSNVTFAPGDIKRHFLMAPEGSSWAVVRIQSNDKDSSGKFVLHCVQLLPKLVVRTMEHHKMFTLQENGEFSHAISVKGGYLLEVCISKWWANFGHISTSYTVTFHGVQSDSREVILHGAEGVTRLDISSPLHHEEISPEIRLKNFVQNYRPVESKIVPLGERDIIPISDRRIFELQLAYNFTLPKATEIVPNFFWLSNVLYESEFESQLWILYNSHKQFVSCGDAYPSKYPAKVDKGDYTIRLHVRCEKRDLLDKLSDLPMSLSSKLSSSVGMDIYSSFAQASTFGKKISSFTLSKGATQPIYIAPLSSGDKYTKNATLGQYLSGTLTLPKDELGKKADVYSIKYTLCEPCKKDKNQSGTNGGSNKKKNDSMAESVAEHKIGWLGKLDYNTEGAKLFEELKQDESANQVQVHVARLAGLEVDKKYDKLDDSKARDALALCDFVQEKLNTDDILAHFAIKHDNRQEANEIRKEMERQKSWLIETLTKKGLALCYLERIEDATEVLFELMKLCDLSDSKVTQFSELHAEKVGHYGRALKLMLGQIESKPGILESEQTAAKLMGLLGWKEFETLAKKSIDAKYPDDYELF